MLVPSRGAVKMTQWTIERHGDGRERTWWPQLRDVWAPYEDFWSTYVAPQTFRILDPDILWVRPGARWPALADCHYAAFSHLAEALAILDEDNELTETASIYGFTSRLYSAKDATVRLAAECSKVMGEYGGAQIRHFDRWCGARDRSDVWRRFEHISKQIGAYRDPHVHLVEIVRIGGRLPTADHVDKYAQLSQLARALADPDVVRAEFAPCKEVLLALFDELVQAMEGVWGFLLDEIRSLSAHDRLLTELSDVSSEDRRILPSLQKSGPGPMSGATGSNAVRILHSGTGTQGPSALSAQGPDETSVP